jgi:hypothetical protein
MKQLSLLCLAVFVALFSACEKNDNNITVTYQEASAVYGDLEALRNQPLNASVRAVENPGKVFVGSDFILLGEEEKGIHVINNSDISNPQFINFINIPQNREFFVKGNFLYAESSYDVVKLDLSNLSNIQLVARAENVFQQPLFNDKGEALIGFTFKEITESVDAKTDLYQEIMDGQAVYRDFARNIIPRSAVPASFAGNSDDVSGTVNRVTQSQGHVYIVNSNNMAVIEDNGTFQQVQQLIPLTEGTETIFPYEDKLFLGSRSEMNIYNASNPRQPEQVYAFEHATSCDPVLATDEVAYITLRTADFSDCPGNVNALVVLNIENLQSPKQEKEIAMESPFGMTTIGDKLFVGEGENGLSIFDITNKKDPSLLTKLEDVKAYDIIAHPSDATLILIAGTDGLSQYTIEGNSLNLTINSRIDY